MKCVVIEPISHILSTIPTINFIFTIHFTLLVNGHHLGTVLIINSVECRSVLQITLAPAWTSAAAIVFLQ